jgi:hypothetical protein
MLSGKDQRLSCPAVIRMLLLCALFSWGASTRLHGSDKKSTSALLFGGYFERPPIHRFLPGARRTLLFPARISSHGEISPLGSDVSMSSKDWDDFVKGSREDTSLLMATINPLMIRDNHQVIQSAVISSDDPMLASCILNPGFLRRFSAIFGPELIVAMPSRTKIYVFPKLANRLPEMARTIRDDYLISPHPVSTELFELSKKGMKTIGTVDPDDQ